MAENYSFFNSKDHDRVYNTSHWADYFFPLFKSGVYNGDLQVVANGGMNVKIKSGYAWIDGYSYHLTDGLVVDLETASGNMNRADSIVIRLDLTNRWIKAFCRTGSYYAGAGIPPEPEIKATIHEIVIAHISIAAGVTEITQDMITDTRMNGNICGWVCGAVEQINFAQIYDQFNAFFAKQKDRIDTDVIDFEGDIDEKKRDADEYLQTYKGNVDGNKATADEFLERFRRYLQDYTTQKQAEFENWTQEIKGILNTEAEGKLLLMIQELQERTTRVENCVYDAEVTFNMLTSDGLRLKTDDNKQILITRKFAIL